MHMQSYYRQLASEQKMSTIAFEISTYAYDYEGHSHILPYRAQAQKAACCAL